MKDAQTRSLHVISSIRLSAGGPTQSVTRLCKGLNELGAPAEIATLNFKDDLLSDGLTPIHKFQQNWPSKLHRSRDLKAFLDRVSGRFDLIHVHGLWEWPGRYARLAATRFSRPLVISPRGMLEPWSLRQNAAMKRLALALWEGRNLRSASLLHATAAEEEAQIRALGFKNPVAIVPNGLDLPPWGPHDGGTEPIALFLSRFHPKKGADLLLKAWATLPNPGPWRLILAGPDHDGYRASLEALASALGIKDGVTFLEPQFGEDKWALLRRCRLFVLPSHSENFGNVVPEALSQGLPVIATQGTPWQGLENQSCGWWVPGTIEGLRTALQTAFGLDDATLAAMGRRGSAWAQSNFNAEATARQMLRHYQQLLQTRP